MKKAPIMILAAAMLLGGCQLFPGSLPSSSSSTAESSLGSSSSMPSSDSDSSAPSSDSVSSSSGSSSSEEAEQGPSEIFFEGKSEEYVSRPPSGIRGEFKLEGYIGKDPYLFVAASSRRSDEGVFLMEEGSTFYNADALVSLSSIELSFELEGRATLYLGVEGQLPASFPLDGKSEISLLSNEDFSSGYTHFRLEVEEGSLLLKTAKFALGETSASPLVKLSFALKATSANLGTAVKDLVGSVSAASLDGKSGLVSDYEIHATAGGNALNGDSVLSSAHEGIMQVWVSYLGIASAKQDVYVYDFSNPNAPEAIVPNVQSLTLYPGESYSFSFSVSPSDYDPSLVLARSSNSEVIEVEGTQVRAIKEGTAEIVLSAPGKEAFITVNVASSKAKVSPISFTARSWSNGIYAPSLGEEKILIVPIHLAGNPSYQWTSDELRQIEEATFSYDNPDSLVSYYKRASNGRMILSGEVYGSIDHMFTASYGEDELMNDDTYELLYEMFDDCLAWLYEQDDIDLDDYDTDDDGHIDSIHFFVDGSDQGQWSSSLWPHMGTVAMAAGTKEEPTIMSYSLSNLAYLGDSALTTIHEQGHIYGIEDYYDYSYMIDTIGGYDMQDMNVGDWNSFSKMSLGWVDPLYLELEPGEEETLTLKPATLGGSPLVLKDGWNGSAYDEYVMIDLWNREGNGSFGGIEGYEAKYDDLGEAGARVYHVDARLWQYTSDYNFWNGAYVTDLDLVRPETYNYQLAHTNTYYMNDYPTYNVAYDSSRVSTYHLLDLIQAGGSNTFSNTRGRQYLTASDFFQSGDAFSMGTYGNAFFYEGSTLNDGSMFRYIVSFENVASEQATVKISAI